MKISTKGRYALKIMLDLALNNTGEYIALKDIAARQNIPVKYTEQIINILNKAGMVKSTRGPSGGYRLSKNPQDYTVGMILRLTEGSLSPVDEDDLDLSDNSTAFVWKELTDAINSVVDRITLADIAAKEKESWENNYCI